MLNARKTFKPFMQMKKMIVNESIERLRKQLPPGTKVYTALKHRSRSGMMRHVSCHVIRDGEVQDITWDVANALGWKQSDNGGIKVGGCGMDMGFHLVYSLGRVLYPDGFKLAANQYGRNGNDTGFDSDGGYSLKQSWI
jgi:hypothetical protein